jgi:hypothetical protein
MTLMLVLQIVAIWCLVSIPVSLLIACVMQVGADDAPATAGALAPVVERIAS